MTCTCLNLIRKHRGEIVAEALKEEVIRGLVARVSEQSFKVDEDGTVVFEMEYTIDRKVVRIAYGVVDKIIELLERGSLNE